MAPKQEACPSFPGQACIVLVPFCGDPAKAAALIKSVHFFIQDIGTASTGTSEWLTVSSVMLPKNT